MLSRELISCNDRNTLTHTFANTLLRNIQSMYSALTTDKPRHETFKIVHIQ